MPSPAPLNPRTAWFEAARFGLFIHWGLYAVPGRGEWIMNRERIPADVYRRFADRFTAEAYDPAAWARLARDAGMRYAVLTTKHHEGFCLWNSATCAFNAVHSAARRDLVAEYVEAFRAAGLKVGLYYSLGDWHHPDWARGWAGDAAARDRFMDYTHALVRELMTGYGPIDLLFYDLPQGYSAAEWRTVDLNAMVRSHQPHILINNRAMTTEDYATPEQHVAAAAPGRPWEACMTLNDNWGFAPHDHHFKSPRQVVGQLAAVAAGAGNLLLNVGPDPQGRIPAESAGILAEVGAWLRRHGEAIYGTERHTLSWNLWGPISRRGRVLYLFLHHYWGEELVIGGLTPRVVDARFLGEDRALEVRREPTRTVLRGLPATAPDPLLPVVRVELDGEPDQDISRVIGGADIFPAFPG